MFLFPKKWLAWMKCCWVLRKTFLYRVGSRTKLVSTGLTRIGGMSVIEPTSITPVEISAIYVLPTKTSLLLWKYHLSVLYATIRVHLTKSVHFIHCLKRKKKKICPWNHLIITSNSSVNPQNRTSWGIILYQQTPASLITLLPSGKKKKCIPNSIDIYLWGELASL